MTLTVSHFLEEDNMAKDWMKELGRINKATGVQPGDPIPTKNIVAAMDAADMDKEDQAKILSSFMAAHTSEPAPSTKSAEPAAPAAKPEPMTLTQLIALMNDPAALKQAWDKLGQENKDELVAQIKAVEAKLATPEPKAAPTAPVASTAKQVPVGARVSTQKGSYQKTAQGWVDTATNKVVTGAWPGYLNRQYQAVLAKRGITESVKPYHIKISSRKKPVSR